MTRIGWDRAIELFLAFAIAAATIFNVCVANRQWGALRESNDINRKAYNAANRAFVISKGIDAEFQFDSAVGRNLWSVAPKWENTGNSPTRDLHMYVNWCPRNSPLPAGFTFPDLASTGDITLSHLGPHESKLGASYKIGPEIISVVQNHGAMFYFYGWVTYKDLLDEKTVHKTRFCRVVTDFKGNPYDVTGSAIYSECGHDCEDEECDKQPLAVPNDSGLCGLNFVITSKPTPSTQTPAHPPAVTTPPGR